MRLKYILLLLPLLYVFDGSSQSAKIFIQQDTLVKEVLNDSSVISLQKKPFTIKIKLVKLRGVFLSASFDSLYYNTPNSENFKDFKYVGAKSMVEHNFNEKKMLIIDDETLHYWFYDASLDWHRFDKDLTVKNDTVFATRVTERFMDKDNNKTIFPIEEIDKPLLLVFFSTDPKNKTKIPIELFRKKVVIQFE